MAVPVSHTNENTDSSNIEQCNYTESQNVKDKQVNRMSDAHGHRG